MKTLALSVKPLHPPQVVWFRRPDGSLNSLPALRLIASANLMRVLVSGRASGKYAVVDCIIDTGSHFSLMSEDLWRRFLPSVITRLPFDRLTPPALRVITIAGGTFPYELGELAIQLEDQKGTVLPVTIIAKLTRDGGRLPVPLTLGLRGGFLDGRTLQAEPDSTASFGQTWTLADP